jgi:hypothetical protein
VSSEAGTRPAGEFFLQIVSQYCHDGRPTFCFLVHAALLPTRRPWRISKSPASLRLPPANRSTLVFARRCRGNAATMLQCLNMKLAHPAAAGSSLPAVLAAGRLTVRRRPSGRSDRRGFAATASCKNTGYRSFEGPRDAFYEDSIVASGRTGSRPMRTVPAITAVRTLKFNF